MNIAELISVHFNNRIDAIEYTDQALKLVIEFDSHGISFKKMADGINKIFLDAIKNAQPPKSGGNS